jgi:L-fucose mutarotase
MLRYRLTHPDLLAALASAGHGSTVLLADGHYPAATAAGPNAVHVPLNVAPGLVSVTDLLALLVDAVAIESAQVMTPPPEQDKPAIFTEFGRILPAGTPLAELDRFAFYAAAKADDLALIVQTGDVRTYANILLTLGVTQPGIDERA